MHETGLKGWTADDFKRALREGTSKDGRVLAQPMQAIISSTKNMTDTEVEAAFAYLQTLAPVARDTPFAPK